MINMKRKRISLMLTSAPCSTKNLTISIEFSLIAKLSGHLLKIERISLNNDKHEKERKFHKAKFNMKRKEMI